MIDTIVLLLSRQNAPERKKIAGQTAKGYNYPLTGCPAIWCPYLPPDVCLLHTFREALFHKAAMPIARCRSDAHIQVHSAPLSVLFSEQFSSKQDSSSLFARTSGI
jgi:hypothetical protein